MLRNRTSTATGRALPNSSELLCALSGQRLHGRVGQWSRDLVQLHRTRRENPNSAAVIDCLRCELVANINAWTTWRLSGPHGDELADIGLGDVIDRIAAAADRAFHLLMTDDLSGERMHTAWTRLAELDIAYADMVRQVDDGRWCLSPRAKRR